MLVLTETPTSRQFISKNENATMAPFEYSSRNIPKRKKGGLDKSSVSLNEQEMKARESIILTLNKAVNPKIDILPLIVNIAFLE